MLLAQRRFSVMALALAVGATAAAGCGGSTDKSSTAAAAGGGKATASEACSDPRIIQAKNWNNGAKRLPDVPAAKTEGKRIAFIGFGQDNPWSAWVFKAVKCEAEANGATATFIGPPKFDAQVQFQEVSDLATSKNYDALVIVPNDSTSIAPALKRLIAAGVPVVSVLQPAGPDVLSMKSQVPGITGNVIEDLTVNAQAMADGVIDGCKNVDPCEVGVLWGARVLAFDKVKPKIFSARIASNPNIKIVCQTDAGYTQDLGRTQAADCLQAHPKLNVLASQADQQTRGAEASIRAAGRTMGLGEGDLKIVSAYATTYGVSQVRAGKWLQTSYNRPQSLGAAATRIDLLALAGVKLTPEQSFLVQDRDFDAVPNRLTRQVLVKNPEVVGQWEG
jgi:ribose transport system substrate-binding protein